MEIVHEQRDLERYMREAVKVSNDSPVLLDHFLSNAIECDVDCVRDREGAVFIGGVMEHIEQAGVHSGDSACSLPPYYLKPETVAEIKRQTAAMANALSVVGLMNVQFAIKETAEGDVIYVLEVNPRASRTVPFVSKATGIQLAKVAARCMAGDTLAQQGITKEVTPPYFSVKEAVFPFVKFPGVDTILGPEMKSTGEVLGIAPSFHEAMMKGLVAAGYQFKTPGPGSCVIISVKDSDKAEAAELAWKLHDYGYKIYGTPGTAKFLNSEMVPCSVVRQMSGARPNVIDLLESGLVDYIISTSPHGRDPHRDSVKFRRKATELSIPTITAMDTARVLVDALRGDHDISQMELVDIANLHREAAKGE